MGSIEKKRDLAKTDVIDPLLFPSHFRIFPQIQKRMGQMWKTNELGRDFTHPFPTLSGSIWVRACL
jgi:hypothetical protein